MATKFKYIGGGTLPGVPARDLSDEDIAGLDAAAKAMLDAHMKHPDGVRVFDAVSETKTKAPAGE